jgi:hypothetical protein
MMSKSTKKNDTTARYIYYVERWLHHYFFSYFLPIDFWFRKRKMLRKVSKERERERCFFEKKELKGERKAGVMEA